MQQPPLAPSRSGRWGRAGRLLVVAALRHNPPPVPAIAPRTLPSTCLLRSAHGQANLRPPGDDGAGFAGIPTVGEASACKAALSEGDPPIGGGGAAHGSKGARGRWQQRAVWRRARLPQPYGSPNLRRADGRPTHARGHRRRALVQSGSVPLVGCAGQGEHAGPSSLHPQRSFSQPAPLPGTAGTSGA